MTARFIPQGFTAIELTAEEVAAKMEIYVGVSARGSVSAIAYVGKGRKPAFYYSFGNEMQRELRIDSFRKGQAEAREYKAQQKALRSAPHDLKVGDVLMCSWGWEQTNIDFYQVTALKGKCSVVIRPIKSQSSHGGGMTGQCVPQVNAFDGEEMTKRVTNGRVKITSYSSASKAEYTEIAGERIYRPMNWTAYA